MTLAVLAGAVLVAAVLTLLLTRGPDAPPSRAQVLAASLDRALERGAPGTAPALAVLPFTAPPEDESLGQIGAVLCDAVLERLSRSRAVPAATCNAARVAVQVGLDQAQIAQLLGVRQLMHGSLARGGGSALRLRAQLIEARSRTVLWQLDEEFDEARLQELPVRLVDRVVAAHQAAQVARPAPIEAQAYRLYLQSLAQQQQGGRDNLLAARATLEQALALAPDYPPALITNVSLRGQLVALGVGTGAEVDALVRHTAERLQRIDPDGPQTLVLGATAALGERRWLDAYRQIEAAASHAPHYAAGLHTQAGLLMIMGYLDRARRVALQVARLEPLVSGSHERLARAHGLLGDDARMVESAALARDLGRGVTVGAFFGLAALRRGDAEAAEQGYMEALKAFGAPTEWIGPMVRAAVDPSRRAAAVAAFDAMPEATRARLNELFVAYAVAGDAARAQQALERMSRQAVTMWAADIWSPEMAAVRRRPEFTDYLEALGLPALWDAHGAPDRCRKDAGGRYRCT